MTENISEDMIIFHEALAINSYLNQLKAEGKSIGFVPTMGALHEGHKSLIERAKAQNDVCVTSIFVNPTQFNEKSDLENYPRPIEKDIDILTTLDNDILFLPAVDEIYPNKQEPVDISFGHLFETLEAAYRPGHFTGVAMVVKRLLEIIAPDTLYMGQKDLQQFLIIKTLIEKLGLDIMLQMGVTIREEDGLALSSRNLLLNKKERLAAKNISKALFHIKENIRHLPFDKLRAESMKFLNSDDLINLEYFEVVDADNLTPVKHVNDSKRIAVCAAAYVGKVRLIDNVIIS